MDIQVKILGESVGRRFERVGEEARAALRAAANDAAEEIERRGRADIARAGNFGRRWIEGLHVDVTEGGGHIRINVVEDVPYWPVFEFGAVIHGKPLLWIPLSVDYGGDPDAQGVWARDYPKPLFQTVSKKGTPLLMTREGDAPAQAIYFGKEEVVEPQKFHIRDISREVMRRMQYFFSQHFRRR